MHASIPTTRLCAAVLAATLAGCASYGPGGLAPGSGIDQAIATMGPPTGRYALPGGGERLEFARGPAGLHTYMLDFDAQGRLARTAQVLTEASFATLPVGIPREDVLKDLGHPSNVQRIGWQDRVVWSYSFDSVFCQWFQVSLDTEGKVVEAGYGPDPRCEAKFDGP